MQNTNSSNKRIIDLFETVIELFEKFVDKSHNEIIKPFLDGNHKIAKENLNKINSNLTVDNLLKLITKTFENLVSLKINIDKSEIKTNDGDFCFDDAAQNLDEKMKKLLAYNTNVK